MLHPLPHVLQILRTLLDLLLMLGAYKKVYSVLILTISKGALANGKGESKRQFDVNV